ncbi:MAG: hypothetical protein RL026_2218 [Pseudomonadota bacterium]|jgi:uronate dehydrogenase
MRIALTGATGRLGRVVREGLLSAGYVLASNDIKGEPPAPHERDSFRRGDLKDPAVVDELLQGARAVVHLAATVRDPSFAEVIDNNHHALYQLYEGARRQRVGRVVFASSNHAFGLHPVGEKLRLDAPYGGDCFYGLSKIWGEQLGRMYWEKHGIETVALRIGTFMDGPPRNERELATWLGREDLLQLVTRAIEAPPGVGFAPVWGVSANTRNYYDLTEGNAIGYAPVQDAELWAFEVLSRPAAADPVAARYQGGSFLMFDYTPEDQRPRQP